MKLCGGCEASGPPGGWGGWRGQVNAFALGYRDFGGVSPPASSPRDGAVPKPFLREGNSDNHATPPRAAGRAAPGAAPDAKRNRGAFRPSLLSGHPHPSPRGA